MCVYVSTSELRRTVSVGDIGISSQIARPKKKRKDRQRHCESASGSSQSKSNWMESVCTNNIYLPHRNTFAQWPSSSWSSLRPISVADIFSILARVIGKGNLNDQSTNQPTNKVAGTIDTQLIVLCDSTVRRWQSFSGGGVNSGRQKKSCFLTFLTGRAN